MNFPTVKPVAGISGPWTVSFDPKSVQFEQLVSWPERNEPGIKFYSGTATYTKRFDLPANIQYPASSIQHRLLLDLGDLRELAEVRVNGKSLGVVWTPPFRVDITGVVNPAGNVLEIDVVNFWPNRIIGDASEPAEKRFTKTNIRKLTRDTPLIPSGLLGPVTLHVAEQWK